MRNAEVRSVLAADLPGLVRGLFDAGGRMQMAYARHLDKGGIELLYVASPGARQPFLVWRCAVEGPMPSLADIAPLLGWYEREITDLFGLTFEGHPEPLRLVLHEGATPPLPPMDPAYPLDLVMPFKAVRSRVPQLANSDVQQLPFGPVRADVLESAQFVFFYVGEHILYFQSQLFFKHRGMEKRFQGLKPEAGIVLAERVSGVGSIAHALAYCQAVEAACGCEVPPRGRWLRVLLAELERLYNHLHYLGHLCHTTTLKVGEAEGKLLEERAKQINARLTGSRFLRNLLTIGGLRRDLAPGAWLSEALEDLRHDTEAYTERLETTGSHLDRLITTGFLDKAVAFDQGATGPVERASGLDRDLRRDHPYAAYDELPVEVASGKAGDAHARAQVRMAEIETSIALIQRILLLLPDGPVHGAWQPKANAEGLGWSEGPRGTIFYAVHIDDGGQLARVKIKSPSFSNWRVFPFTVHDSNMMDYAINEASFGLTMAGGDR